MKLAAVQQATAFIGLGSNLGDGIILLQEAWKALGRIDGIRLIRLSSPYRTAPVGMASRHWFTNAAGCLCTSVSPFELLQTLMAVEADFGRMRDRNSSSYQDRSLDLDLLYYGNLVLNSSELVLPHPRIGQRLFVLSPLAEIEAEFRDPASGETIAVMEQRLKDVITAGKMEKQEIVRGKW